MVFIIWINNSEAAKKCFNLNDQTNVVALKSRMFESKCTGTEVYRNKEKRKYLDTDWILGE